MVSPHLVAATSNYTTPCIIHSWQNYVHCTNGKEEIKPCMDFQCCSVECHAQKGERMLKYLNNSHRYPDSSGSKHWSACCTIDQVAYTNSATWHLGLRDTFNCKSDCMVSQN